MRVRISALLLVQLCVLGQAAGQPSPHLSHEIEAGGFAIGRFFSGSNELGRLDLDPRSPDNAPQHTGGLGLGLSYAPIARLAVETEIALLPTTTRDRQATVVVLAYRAHALFHFLTGRLRPFLLVGGGATSAVYSTDKGQLGLDTDGLLHGGIGLKLDLPRSLVLRIDGRILFPPRIDDALFTQDFEVLVGLYGRFATKRRPQVEPDPDGDGVRGAADRCPSEAEDLDGFADDDGCPDPDNDGDGVLDKDDQCPLEKGPGKGCPDGDGDGVRDKDDKCPAVAGVADQAGCPEPDGDGDGVLDKDDKCVGEAGPAARGGCPEPVDSDSDDDGIVDKDDKCPRAPESRNGFEDGDGCPDVLPKAVLKLGLIARRLSFVPKKELFRKPAIAALKQTARLLQDHPWLRLEILVPPERGPDAASLAQRRADLLRQYLMEQGIGGERLIARVPEQPNGRTKKKPAKNRAVELRLLIQ